MAQLWTQHGKNHYKKKEHKQHSSVLKVLKQLSNFTGPLIISMIFSFLSCCEKAHDNKDFSCEDSKPCCESWIMTRLVESYLNLWRHSILHTPLFQTLSDTSSSTPPPQSFVPCFFDWMDDCATSDVLFFTNWYYGSTHCLGTLVQQEYPSVFYATSCHVTEVSHTTWFFANTLIWYHTH